MSKDGLLIFTIDSGNFANREMHHVKINREGRELIIQVCHGLFLGLDSMGDEVFPSPCSLALPVLPRWDEEDHLTAPSVFPLSLVTMLQITKQICQVWATAT